jgi:hypothetical protein
VLHEQSFAEKFTPVHPGWLGIRDSSRVHHLQPHSGRVDSGVFVTSECDIRLYSSHPVVRSVGQVFLVCAGLSALLNSITKTLQVTAYSLSDVSICAPFLVSLFPGFRGRGELILQRHSVQAFDPVMQFVAGSIVLPKTCDIFGLGCSLVRVLSCSQPVLTRGRSRPSGTSLRTICWPC